MRQPKAGGRTPRTDIDTPARQKGMEAFLLGMNHADVARAAGVHPSTVCGWLREQKFVDELNRHRAEQLEQAKSRLSSLSCKALDRLAATMDSETARDADRIKAADSILSRAGVARVTATTVTGDGAALLAKAKECLTGDAYDALLLALTKTA